MFYATKDEARQEIRAHWREILPTMTGPARQKVNGETSYICPLCGHGAHGDGLTYDPQSADRNGLHCFGCQFSGDIIDLYQQRYSTDYNEALQELAASIGIVIEDAHERTDGQRAAQKTTGDKKPAQTAGSAGSGTGDTRPAENLDFTAEAERAHAELLATPEALEHFTRRGLSLDTIKRYRLGYDAKGYNHFLSGHPQKQTKAKAWAYKYMLPFIDEAGKVPYFAAEIEDRAQIDDYNPKYRNLKEVAAPVFNQRYITGNDTPEAVFLCEGVFDALSAEEAGGKAIAFIGTGTKRFIDLLEQRRPETVFILATDTDGAGRKASERLKEDLDRLGLQYIEKPSPGGKDYNQYLQEDPQSFRKFIQDAQKEAHRTAHPDALLDFWEKIQTRAYEPYKTELPFFDNLLGGGVIRQTILLLMAAPSAGKTTLCMQIAEQMAAHGKPVVYLNLEMSTEQMLAKAISGRLARKGKSYSALKILQGFKWTDEEHEDIAAAVDEYREKIASCLSYNPTGIKSDLESIRAYINTLGERAKAAGQEAPVIVLDYLHLVSAKGLDVQELIKQTVVMLKTYAIKYDTFCIAITATNRASNEAGQISASSGRDSSNLEYTADYQLSLNYWELDQGLANAKNEAQDMSKLRAQKWRRMIIRVMKSRFECAGSFARVYFHPASNIFYGEFEYMPADPDRELFPPAIAEKRDFNQKRGKRTRKEKAFDLETGDFTESEVPWESL